MSKVIRMAVVIFFSFLPFRGVGDTLVSHCRDYPPELYFDGKTCIGPIPELIEDVLEELGHDIDWVFAPWVRSMKEAKRGNVDLLVRHSMTEQRATFLKPINFGARTRTLYFFKAQSLQAEINSYADLDKVNLGAIRGIFYSPGFSKLHQENITFVGRVEQLVGMLEMGRVDIVVASPTHNMELFENRFERVSFEDRFLNNEYVSIPINSKAMRYYDDIARVILKYRKTGKIKQYYEKYGLTAPIQVFPESEGN